MRGRGGGGVCRCTVPKDGVRNVSPGGGEGGGEEVGTGGVGARDDIERVHCGGDAVQCPATLSLAIGEVVPMPIFPDESVVPMRSKRRLPMLSVLLLEGLGASISYPIKIL